MMFVVGGVGGGFRCLVRMVVKLLSRKSADSHSCSGCNSAGDSPAYLFEKITPAFINHHFSPCISCLSST